MGRITRETWNYGDEDCFHCKSETVKVWEDDEFNEGCKKSLAQINFEKLFKDETYGVL